MKAQQTRPRLVLVRVEPDEHQRRQGRAWHWLRWLLRAVLLVAFTVFVAIGLVVLVLG